MFDTDEDQTHKTQETWLQNLSREEKKDGARGGVILNLTGLDCGQPHVPVPGTGTASTRRCRAGLVLYQAILILNKLALLKPLCLNKIYFSTTSTSKESDVTYR
jgi:hypothetical protein